jgi:hypothetical protein
MRQTVVAETSFNESTNGGVWWTKCRTFAHPEPAADFVRRIWAEV